MKKKFEIIGWEKSKEKITLPITKFGGQPVWVDEPQWPISAGWEGRPMMFVGQIAIAKGMFDNPIDLIAYIFVTHPENLEDDFFDPDVVEWMGGENAVILQPSERNNYKCLPIKEGASLFDKINKREEYIPILKEALDPEFCCQNDFRQMNEIEQKEYFQAVDTNKIGGVPNFFRGDEWPNGKWILLLQLASSSTPFDLRLGDMPVIFAFISSDFKSGGLLIQD